MSNRDVAVATTMGMLAGIIGLEAMEKLPTNQKNTCPKCGGYLHTCEATDMATCIDCFHRAEQE